MTPELKEKLAAILLARAVKDFLVKPTEQVALVNALTAYQKARAERQFCDYWPVEHGTMQ